MASNRPLPGDIKHSGLDQVSLVTWMENVTDLINEIKADHDTNQTHLGNMKTLLNNTAHFVSNHVISTSPVLAIDTNFDVKNTEQTVFVAAGVVYTLGDNTNCNTGTTKTLTASKWGAFAVEATDASTLAPNWAASEYASEALALAAAKALAPTADKCVIGYVTVQAHASGFTAGTDALATGAGGNVANATNYYSLATPILPVVATSAESALANSTDITLLRS